MTEYIERSRMTNGDKIRLLTGITSTDEEIAAATFDARWTYEEILTWIREECSNG